VGQADPISHDKGKTVFGAEAVVKIRRHHHQQQR
jgi:hypothetical protein